jgi:opacity protein-like surface antigen
LRKGNAADFSALRYGGPTDVGDPDGEHIGGSRNGWTWGGGIQYALDQSWSTRIEYRHAHWGTKMTDAAFDLNPANLKDDRVAVGMSYAILGWGNNLGWAQLPLLRATSRHSTIPTR